MPVFAAVATDCLGGCDVPEEDGAVAAAGGETRVVTVVTSFSFNPSAISLITESVDLLRDTYIQYLIPMRLELLHQFPSFDRPFRAAGLWERIVESDRFVPGAC